MNKHLPVLITLLTFGIVSKIEAKTFVLECNELNSWIVKEVVINTEAEFISMDGWIIKDRFTYHQASGEIEAWGVIKEYGNDADFRHIKYYIKEKKLTWSDYFFRPRGVFEDSPPHKYVSEGNIQIMECK